MDQNILYYREAWMDLSTPGSNIRTEVNEYDQAQSEEISWDLRLFMIVMGSVMAWAMTLSL